MLKNTIETIDNVFDEVAEQYLYLKGKDSITDLRLTNYVTFVSLILKAFYTKTEGSRAQIRDVIESLHFSLWEHLLFMKDNYYQYNDANWLLLQLEKRLLQTSTLYEKYCADVDSKERNVAQVMSLLDALKKDQTPMRKGAIWKIKEENFIVGASFALGTDVWLRSIEEISSSVQFLRRLSDFLPLVSKDCKLIYSELDTKI